MSKIINALGIKLEVVGESLDKRDFILSPHSVSDLKSRLIVLDYQGNLKHVSKGNYSFCTDFRPVLTDEGKMIYTYNTPKGVQQGTNGWYENCTLNLLDENFNIIKQDIKCLPYGSITEDIYPQCHDNLIINENHFYFLVNVPVKVRNIPNKFGYACKVLNCVIQEVVNNEVVWQFETINYPELYYASITHNDYGYKSFLGFTEVYQDYIHANSIALSKQGKYIYLCCRNIGILKIEKATNKIEWIIGKKFNYINTPDDFEMFELQHDIRLYDDNSLSVYDNKNSRAIKFNIVNNEMKNIKIVSSDLANSNSMGGCLFGDNYVDMATGHVILKDDQKSNLLIQEKSLITNETTFSIRLTDKYTLYRVHRSLK